MGLPHPPSVCSPVSEEEKGPGGEEERLSSDGNDVTELTSGGVTTLEDVFGDGHPSDQPRLRSRHQAQGYLDGLAAGKARSAQAGFDGGFRAGAELGRRVGAILGLLAALAARDPLAARRLADARLALAPQLLVVDGTNAGPLLRTWRAIAQAEAARCAVRLDLLDGPAVLGDDDDDADGYTDAALVNAGATPALDVPATTARQDGGSGLDW